MTGGEGLATIKMEKQKDSEGIEPMHFELLPIALLEDSSAVLVPTDKQPQTQKRGKLTPEQQVALRSLKNCLVDHGDKEDGVTKVAQSKWVEYHKGDAPDWEPNKRRDHRRELERKKWVTTHDFKSWINKDLDE